ncbi:MAG: MYXO-CTERM sorting domain-containing protein [Polyangiaceae bacterium]|nr:MYXO-CTERM sorting domain-containing protein [Polyangiaceae bacterium]
MLRLKSWSLACAIPAAIAMVAGRADAHPTLYFGEEDIAALKARAADAETTALGYDFASVWKGVQAAADTYRQTPYSVTISIPDPDGSGAANWTYSLSPSLPPPHPNNPNYPPWTKLSRDLQARLETLSFAYVITGDETYLTNAQGTGAIDMALDIAAWSSWTDPYYPCGGASSCLDTSHLTLGMSAAYDIGFNTMTDAQRTTIRNAISTKGLAALADDIETSNSTPGGMAAWFNGYALRVGCLGVGASAIDDDADATSYLQLAHDSTKAFFEAQGADGGAFEGHLYGSYAVNYLMIGAHALERRGMGADLFEDPWLLDVPRFARAFLGSDNRSLANFGDSTAIAHWGATMAALAARGNAEAQWYLKATNTAKPGGLIMFVWANPDLEPKAPEGSGGGAFVAVGNAALRAGFDGAPVLAVKSGPKTDVVGHNHFDHNSFILSAFGEWIAADPGYRSYYNPAERLYTTGTVGHNTVMVDNAIAANGSTESGGQVEVTGGELLYYFDGAGYAKVVGRAPSTYDAGLLSAFDRRILYAKPDLVVVFDEIAAPAAHSYSFLLHAPPTGKFEVAADGPAEMRTLGQNAKLETYLVSSSPLASGYPKSLSHTGAEKYGPYAEWRTAPAKAVTLAAALVPGRNTHIALDNPGFENGLTSWTPREDEETHMADSTVSHGGASSGKIILSSSTTGYFYSETMSVAAGGSVHASVFVRAEDANGTFSVQPYWTKGGAYIENPGGEPKELAVSGDLDWTEMELDAMAPPSGVDGVRIALQFSGSGTVWFDDATYEASGVEPPSEPSRAVALGDPPVGLVVDGSFGTEAAASFLGTGITGMTTVEPASAAGVASVGSDGAMYAVGLDPTGRVKRGWVQGGSVLEVDGEAVATASKAGSWDFAVQYDDNDCARVVTTEVETLEASPYVLKASPLEVWLGGERVPFEQDGAFVRYPAGEDIGPGCPIPSDGGGGAGGGAPNSGGGAATDDGGDSETDDGASEEGCSCQAVGNGNGSTGAAALAVLVALLHRRRRRAAP